ncbi:MAG: Uncharacterised protein [Rhodospirillaceae bacterium]|nr:MAG: Uncharacterised protein [Rhodospirillaceae bacterium]
MTFAEPIKGNIAAYLAIKLKLNAALFQQFCASLNDIFFQLKAGNTIDHQAADTVIAVINNDLIPLAAKQVSSSKASRPRTNNTNRLLTLSIDLNRLYPALIKGCFGNIFLNRTDGNRLKALFDNAIAFAQPVLRANTATNFWKSVGCRR